jgi:hypothetical protein
MEGWRQRRLGCMGQFGEEEINEEESKKKRKKMKEQA